MAARETLPTREEMDPGGLEFVDPECFELRDFISAQQQHDGEDKEHACDVTHRELSECVLKDSERPCKNERKQMAVARMKIRIGQRNLHMLRVWTVFETGYMRPEEKDEKSEGSGLLPTQVASNIREGSLLHSRHSE